MRFSIAKAGRDRAHRRELIEAPPMAEDATGDFYYVAKHQLGVPLLFAIPMVLNCKIGHSLGNCPIDSMRVWATLLSHGFTADRLSVGILLHALSQALRPGGGAYFFRHVLCSGIGRQFI
ncbi:MAG TPA: hypothetical protein VN036_12295 [Devosia sp.]|nr:hypothetical protein [Devosia sp.]